MLSVSYLSTGPTTTRVRESAHMPASSECRSSRRVWARANELCTQPRHTPNSVATGRLSRTHTHTVIHSHTHTVIHSHTHSLTHSLSCYRCVALVHARVFACSPSLLLSRLHPSSTSSHKCLQSAIAPVLLPFLFWLLRVPRLQPPCARAPIRLLSSSPSPQLPSPFHNPSNSSCWELLLFIIWLLLWGSLKGLICICTLWVLCARFCSSAPAAEGNRNRYRCRLLHARARAQAQARARALAQALARFHNVHNNKATSIVHFWGLAVFLLGVKGVLLSHYSPLAAIVGSASCRLRRYCARPSPLTLRPPRPAPPRPDQLAFAFGLLLLCSRLCTNK